jgi:hypothetical protein
MIRILMENYDQSLVFPVLTILVYPIFAGLLEGHPRKICYAIYFTEKAVRIFFYFEQIAQKISRFDHFMIWKIFSQFYC